MADPLIVDFFRHGIAEDPQPGQDDTLRQLTDKGIARTQQVAKQLKALGWGWDRVLTSPLKRSQQTAAILLKETLTTRVEEFIPLAPGGSFTEFMAWHQAHPELKTLAVVGHQPDLGHWVSTALWGETISLIPDRIQLKKAGVARVEFASGLLHPQHGTLLMLLRPKVLVGL